MMDDIEQEARKIASLYPVYILGKPVVIEGLVKDIADALRKADELRVMQLAAISTASIQNTKKSAGDRIDRDNPYWTVAYDDVCKAVDREMELGARLKHIMDFIKPAESIEEYQKAWEELHDEAKNNKSNRRHQ